MDGGGEEGRSHEVFKKTDLKRGGLEGKEEGAGIDYNLNINAECQLWQAKIK